MNERSQNYAAAKSKLDDAVCAESRMARWDRLVTSQIIDVTLEKLPDNVPDERRLHHEVVGRCRELKHAGVIVVGLIGSIIFEILIGIVVSLIVKWITRGGAERDMVMRARR